MRATAGRKCVSLLRKQAGTEMKEALVRRVPAPFEDVKEPQMPPRGFSAVSDGEDAEAQGMAGRLPR